MAKKNIFAQRRKTDLQAEAWFDRSNDNIPFEAFADEEEKTQTGEEMLTVIRRKLKEQRSFRRWRNVAAAAVILVTASVFSYRAYLASPPINGMAQAWKSYAANKGEFKKILLPDSSVVHLRPGSKIAIAQPFIQQTRQLKLEIGEVYFEVSHDPVHPFLVSTGPITTEVLGTKFIINNDALSADIHVALLSGKVAVRSQKAQLGILLPNHQLSFNRNTEAVKLENSNAYSSENWLNGEYILEDVPLKSFAKTFGNAFSMEVRFRQEALEKLKVSIQFNRYDNFKTILDQLKLIHGLQYEIKDKEVILMR
ncbi:FecR family protein [Pedobacter nyackensis]|uniref:FecR family protein n=1 Tax=Pedobacter nyackensis TaxID=475255 RepID=UPI00292CDA71|nr:FecR domain-containing protein [Pedobacter nyackensis]